LASAMTAPLGSTTVPESVAFATCAYKLPTGRMDNKRTASAAENAPRSTIQAQFHLRLFRILTLPPRTEFIEFSCGTFPGLSRHLSLRSTYVNIKLGTWQKKVARVRHRLAARYSKHSFSRVGLPRAGGRILSSPRVQVDKPMGPDRTPPLTILERRGGRGGRRG
jgi:hypothetical protein